MQRFDCRCWGWIQLNISRSWAPCLQDAAPSKIYRISVFAKFKNRRLPVPLHGPLSAAAKKSEAIVNDDCHDNTRRLKQSIVAATRDPELSNPARSAKRTIRRSPISNWHCAAIARSRSRATAAGLPAFVFQTEAAILISSTDAAIILIR